MSTTASEAGWRALGRLEGPVVTLAAVVAIETLAATSWWIPNPPALLMLAIVFATFRGDATSGWISAAISWTYCFYYFAESIYPLAYSVPDLRRLLVWAVVFPLTAAMVGRLRRTSRLAESRLGQQERLERELRERRAVEHALRESEARSRADSARFQAIADSAPVGIFETDAEGKTLFVNRLWRALTGREIEDAAGDRWLEAVHPDDRERVAAGWFRDDDDGRALEATYRLVHPSGEARWVEGRAVELRDEAGTVTGYLGTLVDVTAIRSAERVARRRGAILSAVGFAGQLLMRHEGLDGAISEVLARLGEAAGVSRAYLFENSRDAGGDLLASLRFEWAAPGVAPQIDNPELQQAPYEAAGLSRWRSVFLAGGMIHGRVASLPEPERQVLAPQGILSLAVLPISIGGELWGFIGFDDCAEAREWSIVELDALRAATATIAAAIERQAALQELRASERRFRELFDSSPVEIWEEDLSGVHSYLAECGFLASPSPRELLAERKEIGREAFARVRVRDVNRKAVESLRAPDKATLLASLDRIFTPEAYSAFEEQLLAMHRGDRSLTSDSAARAFDGTRIESILHWEVQPGHEADYSRVLISVVDVTEPRAMRREIERSRRLESVGRLAGGVAHDFNNLLTVILNSAEFLAPALEEREQPLADLRRIQSAGRQASALTHQLLAFSRRQILSPQVVDIHEVIRDLRDLLIRVLPASIETKLDLAAAPGLVEVDPGQIEQVLLNLALNARDAMPDGGTIDIATRGPGPPPEALPAGTPPGRSEGVLIVVRDDGAGMDAETLERCFEPFYTTKAAPTGTGLGLATAYGIVSQSGGAIWAQSAPGRGSSFSIFLPRPSAAASAAPASPATDAIRTGDERILLVEDDASVRSMIDRMLRRLGYDVHAATTPTAALEIARSGPPFDLLITDVVMSEMSGTRLSAELADLPALFVSGYAIELVERESSAPLHFLQKPFTLATLGDAVRRALDGA